MNLLNLFFSAFWPTPNRPAPRMPPAPPAPPTGGPEPMELADLINRLRARMGLLMLTPDPRLMEVAASYAAAMAARDVLEHGDAQARIWGVYPGTATGECIAEGQPTPVAVAQAWWNDPPHQAIMLGDYNRVGCWLAYDAAGVAFWVADFCKA